MKPHLALHESLFRSPQAEISTPLRFFKALPMPRLPRSLAPPERLVFLEIAPSVGGGPANTRSRGEIRERARLSCCGPANKRSRDSFKHRTFAVIANTDDPSRSPEAGA